MAFFCCQVPFAGKRLPKHKECLLVVNQVVRLWESCVVEIKFIKGDDGDEQIDGICLDGPAAVSGSWIFG
jgi:hypothetical protein